MTRFKVYFGTVKGFKSAFFATTCSTCSHSIEVGDPTGQLTNLQGVVLNPNDYLCAECLKDYGTPASIEIDAQSCHRNRDLPDSPKVNFSDSL